MRDCIRQPLHKREEKKDLEKTECYIIREAKQAKKRKLKLIFGCMIPPARVA